MKEDAECSKESVIVTEKMSPPVLRGNPKSSWLAITKRAFIPAVATVRPKPNTLDEVADVLEALMTLRGTNLMAPKNGLSIITFAKVLPLLLV